MKVNFRTSCTQITVVSVLANNFHQQHTDLALNFLLLECPLSKVQFCLILNLYPKANESSWIRPLDQLS